MLDAWLSACVGWVTSWGAIVGVKYYLNDPHSVDFDHHFDPVGTNRLRDVDLRGLGALASGMLAAWLFMHGMVPATRGPVSQAMGGLDLSWLAAAITAGSVYFFLTRRDRKASALGASEVLAVVSPVP